MKRHLHTIIFAFIIGLTMLHDAHLIAFQPNMNLAIAATIYLAVDATPVSYTHLTLPTNREV